MLNKRSLHLIVLMVVVFLVVEGIPYKGAEEGAKFNSNSGYRVTFNETGLPDGTQWTVKVIVNNSANETYTSDNSSLNFTEVNGSYSYVVLGTYSFITPEAAGVLNISGSPVYRNISFERDGVSEYYLPYTIMNSSQERQFLLNPEPGPSALSFGVMNTSMEVSVFGGSGLIYQNNITGGPTNFNTATSNKGYAYINFQDSGAISVYTKDTGNRTGYFALDLWNYYISNYTASLITLPPHLQQVFGTGILNERVPSFIAPNNTGMSFVLRAPYYREAVPMAIFVGEGVYNPVNGDYWWAQLGFNNWYTGMYDVSYAGWGIFSNYANTTGGTDQNFPLVPNETYNFTMETVSNGSWEFLVNGIPVNESGHSAFYRAPTDYAGGNAYLGIEVLVGQRAGINETHFFNGSIVIPCAESFRINGEWVRASNVSFLYGVRDWEDGQGGSCAGMNLWGIQGNIQNRSIPKGEIVLNDGPQYPFEVPDGQNYDIYPISGNFSFPVKNSSSGGIFVNVSREGNGTLKVAPDQPDTEVSVVIFNGTGNIAESEYSMLISRQIYIEDPSMDSRAAIFAAPLNATTSQPGYSGVYQEIVLNPILLEKNESSPFTIGNVGSSYGNEIYVPVYLNGAKSLKNLMQIYSYDSSVLEFKGVLKDLSSENITFEMNRLSADVEEIYAQGSFTIIQNNILLYYLEFNPTISQQVSTSIILDLSTINGFAVRGTSTSNITLSAGWRNIGPSRIHLEGSNLSYGGMVSLVGYSPYNMSIIYAAAGQNYPFSGPNGYPGDTGFGGMLVSRDGGESWAIADLGITSASVTSIAVDPSDPEIAVVETRGMQANDPVGGGIFKTVNGGLCWEETYSLGGYQLQYENGTLFATTFSSILKSENFGTTWSLVSSFSGVVTSSLVLNGGTDVYVGIWKQDGNVTDQLLESTNYGKSYEMLITLNQSEFHGKEPSIGQIIASPSDAQDMWMVVDSPYPAEWVGNPSLFRSLDGGNTWQLFNTTAAGLGAQQEPPTYITYWQQNGSVMYLDGLNGLYVSRDGGNYFMRMNVPANSSFLGMVSPDPVNGSILFLCSESGLFESLDSGESWNSLSNFSTNLLFDVAADGNYIFATAEGMSPLYSNDSGANWTTITKGYLGIASADPYNSSIVILWTETHTIVGGPFFFVSDNGGKSFFLPSINFTAEVSPSVSSVGFSQRSIYVPGGSGIFISNDSGLTWSLIPGSPKYASQVSVSPSDQSVLYASNETGLYISNNSGSSWSLIYSGYLNSVSVDPENPSVIAATGFFGSWYSYRPMISYDWGRNFLPLGLLSQNYMLSSSYIYFQYYRGNEYLVFTSDQGLFISDNMGESWINCSYNLPSTVINSFFLSQGGEGYVATYGAGIFMDEDILNLTFFESNPVITGYVPAGRSVSIDNISMNGPGYFSEKVKEGMNTILWEGEDLYLNTSAGKVYFFNFSLMQKFITVEQEGLPVGTVWDVYAEGSQYSVNGTVTLALPPGTGEIYVPPVGTDYSIYCPEQSSYYIGSSLTSSISVVFNETIRSSSINLTKAMDGMFWSTQIAYNRGYILYAGGTVGLLNVTTDEGQRLQSSDYSGVVDTAVPFSTGFLVGGSASQDRPSIYYYNISTGEFTNLSSLLPASWNASNSAISSLFVVNSSAFGFIGGSVNSVYFGVIYNNRFVDLTSYLPSSFTPSNGWYDRYSGAYLSSCQGFILSDGADIGIFYLQNKSFQDISALMPNGFFVGMGGNEWSPSSDFISSNNTTAIITGKDNTGQFTLLYSPDTGIRDISSLFPPSEYMDTVTWQGKDIVLSGHESNGGSSSIFIYNTSRKIPTAINTSYYGNTSMIDSAIMVGNSVYFTTFNVKTVPNENYVILSSYYGAVSLTPTGLVNIRVNTPSSIEINNETYFATTASIPEFTGNYTLTVSSSGYVSYATSVDVSPFENLYLNVTLEIKSYGITFTENGLPSGISWSVTLNGTTESSTSNSITFQEPNGSYSYTVGIYQGYSASPYSGTVTVNGGSQTVGITFTQVKYSVTFTETGLTSSTKWYVNITGQLSSGPIPSTITSYSVYLANGTYSYTVATGNKQYKPLSYSGSFTVNGAAISQSITFSEVTYSITFSGIGLPLGTSWSLTLNGTTESSTNSTITFNEPNGSYPFQVLPPSGFSVSPLSGKLTVSGSNVSETLLFTPSMPKVYSIMFTESGLTSGTSWSISLNGTTLSSSNNTIEFTEPNGSYFYTIQTIPGYRTTDYSGSFKVNGNSVDEDIEWAMILYPIIMTEYGIPSGTSWSATLTGTTFNGQSVNVTLSSTNSTVIFNEPNGTYSYVVHLPSGYTSSNSKGTLNVSGASLTSSIAAKQVSTTGSNTTDYLIYAIVAVIIVIAVMGVVFAMRRKR